MKFIQISSSWMKSEELCNGSELISYEGMKLCYYNGSLRAWNASTCIAVSARVQSVRVLTKVDVKERERLVQKRFYIRCVAIMTSTLAPTGVCVCVCVCGAEE